MSPAPAQAKRHFKRRFFNRSVLKKAVQIAFDFFYTTYKSVTIHKNMEHAFNPGFMYRLKRGLVGDICYFIAGIVVIVNADAIRGFFA